MIFTDSYKLSAHIDKVHPGTKIVLTSGGFDPLHLGHLQCIQGAAEIKDDGILVVVCNSNDWLVRKKGYAFMPEIERLSIVDALKGVDYTLVWDDGGPTVCGAIEAIRPDIFAKGGDRDSSKNVPEFDLCEQQGCEVVFGVGGGKIQSSSELVKKFNDREGT
jgi:cytidyltransferase-like protein